MADRPAVLHLARRADDRGLAVAHRRTTEEVDEPLREHRPDLEADVEQRREVIDESSRERVLHDDDGRRPVNRGRQGLAAVGHDLFDAHDALANLHGCRSPSLLRGRRERRQLADVAHVVLDDDGRLQVRDDLLHALDRGDRRGAV